MPGSVKKLASLLKKARVWLEAPKPESLKNCLLAVTLEERLQMLKIQEKGDGCTVIHSLVFTKNTEKVVQCILDSLPSEHRYDLIKIPNKLGNTALHHATLAWHTTIIATVTCILNSLTPEDRIQFLRLTNGQNQTAGELAIKGKHKGMANYLQERLESAQSEVEAKRQEVSKAVKGADIIQRIQALENLEKEKNSLIEELRTRNRLLESQCQQNSKSLVEFSAAYKVQEQESKEKDVELKEREVEIRNLRKSTQGGNRHLQVLKNSLSTDSLTTSEGEEVAVELRSNRLTPSLRNLDCDSLNVNIPSEVARMRLSPSSCVSETSDYCSLSLKLGAERAGLERSLNVEFPDPSEYYSLDLRLGDGTESEAPSISDQFPETSDYESIRPQLTLGLASTAQPLKHQMLEAPDHGSLSLNFNTDTPILYSNSSEDTLHQSQENKPITMNSRKVRPPKPAPRASLSKNTTGNLAVARPIKGTLV